MIIESSLTASLTVWLDTQSLSLLQLLVASVFCVGLIPLLLGLFFDILVIMPLRLSADQTPIHFVWQSWALGVLHSKIFCAITVIGPNWWLKTVIDRSVVLWLPSLHHLFLVGPFLEKIVDYSHDFSSVFLVGVVEENPDSYSG